jgi:hypothetical protein
LLALHGVQKMPETVLDISCDIPAPVHGLHLIQRGALDLSLRIHFVVEAPEPRTSGQAPRCAIDTILQTPVTIVLFAAFTRNYIFYGTQKM